MNDIALAEVKEMISRDNIPGAFAKLNTLDLEKSVSESLMLLEGRFTSLNRQVRMGTISYAESSVEKSRIVYGLIGLLDEIKTGGGSARNNTSAKEPVKEPQTDNTTVISKTKILFFASNPANTGQLRLGEECREIEAGLQRSRKRELFEIKSHWAVRSRDLSRAMLDENPQIIHFSGHGESFSKEKGEEGDRGMNYKGKHGEKSEDSQLTGGIVLEANDGSPKIVSAKALAELFELFSENIQCVFLNACYSKFQADAIIKHVPYVIGMNKSVPDDVAIAFAVGFYDALGNGRGIEFAFKFAKNAISMEGLSGSDIPVLIKREA